MKDIKCVIIDKDPTANEVLKQFIADNTKVNDIKQFLELDRGYDYISKNVPELIFIDIEYGETVVFETVSKILKNKSECAIVITAKKYNAEFIIKAMKSGAKEILQKPVLKSEFDKIIEKIVNEINYEAKNNNSKVISIFSNKGGVGKTTISTNLALEIAEITNQPSVIVDFNSQFGDVSTFLNVKTDFGISYLLANKEKINKEFLLSILPKYNNSNLYVLSDLFYLNDIKDLTLENVQDIIDALKAAFSYIIIDMTNVFDLKTVKILDNSDDILFPIVANIPNLRNCNRCLEFFNKMKYKDEKIKLILNRTTSTDEITKESIESTLNKKIYAKLINDYYIVKNAINRGIGISRVDNNSQIAKSFQNLAYSLITENKKE